MAHLDPLRRLPWSEYLDSIYRLLRVCFFTLMRFPYISAVIALLTCLYDLYDFFSHYLSPKIPDRSPIISAAASRFGANILMGLGYLVPLVTIAVFMVINPIIIPLVALHPAVTDFFKFFYIFKVARQNENALLNIYLDNPTESHLKNYHAAKEKTYSTKQDMGISTGLLLGTAITAAGLVFPPLIFVGLALSVGLTVMGLADKKYRWSKKISEYFYPEKNNFDFCGIEESSVISMKPILINHHRQEINSYENKKNPSKYGNFFQRKEIRPQREEKSHQHFHSCVMRKY